MSPGELVAPGRPRVPLFRAFDFTTTLKDEIESWVQRTDIGMIVASVRFNSSQPAVMIVFPNMVGWSWQDRLERI